MISEQNKQELIVTRGISNSGKSTWTEKWVSEDPENRRRVNRDNIRAAGFNIPSYSWGEEKLVTAFQQGAVELLLKEGRSVAVDDMHLKAKYVRWYYDLAEELGVKFTVKSFPIELDEALRRAKKRAENGGLEVPEDRIRDMFSRTMNGTPYPLPDFSLPKVVTGRAAVLEDPEIYVPDTTKPEAIIVDIDGTLTDGIHPERGEFEWDKVGLDLPRPYLISVVKMLHDQGAKVLITSGREDVCKAETIEWLGRHGIPFDSIFMRAEGDRERDDIVKLEIFNEHIRPHYNIKAVFDDRGRVVRMWHCIGLPLFRLGDPFSDF